MSGHEAISLRIRVETVSGAMLLLCGLIPGRLHKSPEFQRLSLDGL
jgi:hypothetical protein